jgi:hypothetical protein
MFVGKARNITKSEAQESFFTQVGCLKHWTRLEGPAGDKHSSLAGLLSRLVNDEEKKVGYFTQYLETTNLPRSQEA